MKYLLDRLNSIVRLYNCTVECNGGTLSVISKDRNDLIRGKEAIKRKYEDSSWFYIKKFKEKGEDIFHIAFALGDS